MKRKICFSLFNYKKETPRHYLHIYEFIEALGARTDLRLLVMDAEDPPDFKSPTSVIDLSGKGFSAKLRRWREIVRARCEGYKVFYHHYTTAPARFSALINRITGGRTYLWHCVVMEALDKMGKRSPLHWWLMRLTLTIIHHQVTGSDRMAEYYSKLYKIRKDKIKVIPNYINTGRFNADQYDQQSVRKEMNLPVDKKIILFLHGIVEGRAIHLAEIVQNMLAIRDDCFFLIAGDGYYRPVVESKLNQYVQCGKVRFAGHVSNTEAPKYYAAADVYIMTSDFEAFSRVLLEAMSMGVPYVSTDGDGNIRIYTPPEHQPYILPVNQIGKFPERISKLLDDPEERTRFIKAGLENVQKYKLERVLDIFLNTIAE